MISVADLRRHTYPIINLLAQTGLPMEIIVKDKVYALRLQFTDVKPKRRRTLRPLQRKPEINTYTLNYGDCRECGYLTVNDNCLNMSCITLKTDPKTFFNPERVKKEWGDQLDKFRRDPQYEGSPLNEKAPPA